MQTHVKVLGVLYLVFSGLFLVMAALLLLVMGGAAGIVGVAGESQDAALAIPILGIVGTFLGAILVALSLPGLLAGYGLLHYHPWARVLALVLSALNLINIPIGTILGAYGLWVLLNKDTEPLFSPAADVTPSGV